MRPSTTHMTAKGVMGGAGAAVFGDHFEPGREVEKKHLDNIQNVFDRFFGAETR